MRLAGSGTTDPKWLEKIIVNPPTSLSTLEYWVGALDVEFAGAEGHGHVTRPSDPPRGNLRREIKFLAATFAFDPYHERAERPRDMSLRSLRVHIDVDATPLLEAKYGAGRAIEYEGRTYLELGRHFYAAPGVLLFEVERPTWALPRVADDAYDVLLARLVDQLASESRLEAVLAAIAPYAKAANVDASRSELAFRPGVPLATVVAALGWASPVASAGDVHMTTWQVMPDAEDWQRRDPHVGQWRVEIRIGWPRAPDGSELPVVGRHGPSPLYDVRGCQSLVRSVRLQHCPHARPRSAL